MALFHLALSCRTWLVVAASVLQGCANPHNSNMSNQVDIVATLTRQADAWDKAIVRKDRAAIEANMEEDFRHIDSQGNVNTKKPFVEDLMSNDLVIDPYSVEDFDVRLYGDVALLCGRTQMTGMYQGKAFTSHYRYIDIYVHRGGAWKIVSVQISKIPT
jgi:ketosteroid isomerase-like protein